MILTVDSLTGTWPESLSDHLCIDRCDMAEVGERAREADVVVLPLTVDAAIPQALRQRHPLVVLLAEHAPDQIGHLRASLSWATLVIAVDEPLDLTLGTLHHGLALSARRRLIDDRAGAPLRPPTADTTLPTTSALEAPEPLLQDYRRFIDAELRSTMERRGRALRYPAQDQLVPLLDHLLRDLKAVLGSATLVGAAATTMLVQRLTEVVGRARQRPEIVDEDLRQRLGELLMGGIDLVWELADAICTLRDETAVVTARAVCWHENHRLVQSWLQAVKASDVAEADLVSRT